ncbi:MAG: toll/interleukin-1 receptor domain-containing protein [Planctomycetota bacterium]
MSSDSDAWNTLAELFGSGRAVRGLLVDAGVPATSVPVIAEPTAPIDLWRHVRGELQKGLLPNPLPTLTRLALERYPHNKVLSEYLRGHQARNTTRATAAGPGKGLFASYCTEDRPFVDAVLEQLDEQVPGIWNDANLAPGEDVLDEISRALTGADRFVYFCGRAPGPWQRKELGAALTLEHEGRLRILPVLLLGTEPEHLPVLIRTRAAIRFSSPSDPAAIAKLTAALQRPGAAT